MVRGSTKTEDDLQALQPYPAFIPHFKQFVRLNVAALLNRIGKTVHTSERQITQDQIDHAQIDHTDHL